MSRKWALLVLAVAVLTMTVPTWRGAVAAASPPRRVRVEAPQIPAQVFLTWDYDFTRIPGCTAGQQECIYEFRVLRVTEVGESWLATVPAPMGATGLFVNLQAALPAPGMGLTTYGVRAFARDSSGATVPGAIAVVDYRLAPAAPQNLRVQ